MIAAEELRAQIHYNPLIGTFIWVLSKRRGWNGKHAGWTDKDGYLLIRLSGVLYQAHRLAWLYMTGAWPKGGFIDHKNGVPSDNRWKNLREATVRLNQENRRTAGRNNKTGFLGVSPNGRRFAATINSKGMHHYLGTFDTPEQAHVVYVTAKRQLHEGCTI